MLKNITNPFLARIQFWQSLISDWLWQYLHTLEVLWWESHFYCLCFRRICFCYNLFQIGGAFTGSFKSCFALVLFLPRAFEPLNHGSGSLGGGCVTSDISSWLFATDISSWLVSSESDQLSSEYMSFIQICLVLYFHVINHKEKGRNIK